MVVFSRAMDITRSLAEMVVKDLNLSVVED